MRNQPITDLKKAVLADIPALPAVITYYDDFSDCYNKVARPDRSDRWKISFDGRTATLDFCDFDHQIRRLIKCWCAFVLGCLTPVTAYKYLGSLRAVPIDQIETLLTCHPRDVRSHWKLLQTDDLSTEHFVSLKSILAFLCRFCLGEWKPEWLDLVSQLPLPKRDKYASVRIGDVFLNVEEEATIVRHIDEVCTQVQARRSGITVLRENLADPAILEGLAF